MNELALTTKAWEQWGGEEFQAEATVGSEELILCSCVCVCVSYISYVSHIYITLYMCMYIFNHAQ